MGFYPAFIQLDGQSCAVIGGGSVAARKVDGLLSAGGKVTVISPTICDELVERLTNGEIDWRRKKYESGDLAGFFLAVTATDDPEVNRQVFVDGELTSVLVNSADDPENCRYILPSVVRRGDLVIAISTAGRSPAMAAHMRKEIESTYGPEWSILTDLLAEARDEIRGRGETTEGMSDKWEAAISDEVLESIRTGDLDQARKKVRECLS